MQRNRERVSSDERFPFEERTFLRERAYKWNDERECRESLLWEAFERGAEHLWERERDFFFPFPERRATREPSFWERRPREYLFIERGRKRRAYLREEPFIISLSIWERERKSCRRDYFLPSSFARRAIVSFSSLRRVAYIARKHLCFTQRENIMREAVSSSCSFMREQRERERWRERGRDIYHLFRLYFRFAERERAFYLRENTRVCILTSFVIYIYILYLRVAIYREREWRCISFHHFAVKHFLSFVRHFRLRRWEWENIREDIIWGEREYDISSLPEKHFFLLFARFISRERWVIIVIYLFLSRERERFERTWESRRVSIWERVITSLPRFLLHEREKHFLLHEWERGETFHHLSATTPRETFSRGAVSTFHWREAAGEFERVYHYHFSTFMSSMKVYYHTFIL